jgi:hypothetical protein
LLLIGLMLPVSQPASAATGLVVGGNVNTSRLAGNQAETAIAINPTNPSNIVITSNVQFGAKLFKSVSFDSGVTWSAGVFADGTDGLDAACCDPSMAFDEFGNLFLVYLDVKAHDVEVALSTDGGLSFRSLGAVEDTHGGDGTNAKIEKGTSKGPGVDQPTVATGPGGVWVTYKLFAKQQLLRVSGAPVTGKGGVGAFTDPLPVPGSKAGTFGDIVVGPNGQVMVTYQDNIPTEGPSTIFVNLDPDGFGPQGFGPAIRATSTNVGGFDFIPPQALRSVDAEAGLTWDRSGGPNDGRVYLVYTNERPNESNNTNIFVRYSNNQGKTWSAPVRVNDDAGKNSQFNPQVEVDQTTGIVGVSFHDARHDKGNGAFGDTNGIPNDDAQYFATVSRDGGVSFAPNVRVAAGTSNAEASENGVQYGDYTGIAFFGGSMFPAWADNSNITGDNPDGELSSFDIYTARITVA